MYPRSDERVIIGDFSRIAYDATVLSGGEHRGTTSPPTG